MGGSLYIVFIFFIKVFGGHMSFFGATKYHLFWISGDVSSGFQSQSGFCLIRYFGGGECNVHSPRFTSGATLADLLAAGAQPVTSPHACAEVWTWLSIQTCNRTNRSTNRATIVPATRLYKFI